MSEGDPTDLVSEIEAAARSSTPAAPAGWYPDPEAPDHQRYWNGSRWTGASKPAATQATAGAWPAQVIVALLGCAIVALSAFLPAADSSQALVIRNNSLIQSGGGFGFLILALLTGIFVVINRAKPGRSIGLVLPAALVILLAVSYEPDLHNGFGRSVQADPGIGVYVAMLGGALIFISAFMHRERG